MLHSNMAQQWCSPKRWRASSAQAQHLLPGRSAVSVHTPNQRSDKAPDCIRSFIIFKLLSYSWCFGLPTSYFSASFIWFCVRENIMSYGVWSILKPCLSLRAQSGAGHGGEASDSPNTNLWQHGNFPETSFLPAYHMHTWPIMHIALCGFKKLVRSIITLCIRIIRANIANEWVRRCSGVHPMLLYSIVSRTTSIPPYTIHTKLNQNIALHTILSSSRQQCRCCLPAA